MRKSMMIRMGCLVLAAVVLSGALMVAAFTGSPYATLKNSVLDTMMLKNGAVKAEISYTLDGDTQEMNKYDSIVSENASYGKRFDTNGIESGFNYNSENLYLAPDYLAPDGTQWYYAYIPGQYRSYAPYMPFGIGGLDEETRNSAQMRFIELAIDALVGDLKNNVTMTESNGIRHVSGTLTESQLPELARAALDMAAEQTGNYYSHENVVSIDLSAGKRVVENISISRMKKTVTTIEQDFIPMTEEIREQLNTGKFTGEWKVDYYGSFYYPRTQVPGGGYEMDENSREYMITSYNQTGQYTVDATRADFDDRDPMNMPMKSIVINYVHGETDIDAAGNIIAASANGTAELTTVFGDTFTIEMRASLSITDIGTAIAFCPIPDAEQVLTRDFIKSKIGDENQSFYFKLNPDGTVDRTSVTTTWPGENGPQSAAWPQPDIEVRPIEIAPYEVDGGDTAVESPDEPNSNADDTPVEPEPDAATEDTGTEA